MSRIARIAVQEDYRLEAQLDQVQEQNRRMQAQLDWLMKLVADTGQQ